MNITALAHVCLYGADLDAMTRFYCDVLGLKKIFNFNKKGRVVGFYLKVAEHNYIEVFEAANPTTAKGACLSHFCLETSSLEVTRKCLEDAGYNPTPIKLGADQSYQFWVKDPAGVDLEFHEYTAESSQLVCRDVEVNW